MIKIRSVLTALGRPDIQKTIKENNINVVANDIQYKEGILEYLNESIDINYLIIDDKIPGEITTMKLIEEIKNKNNRIKIILISKEDKGEINVYKKLKQLNVLELVEIINEGIPYINPYMSIRKKEEKQGKIITILGPNGIGKSIFTATFAKSLDNKKVLIIDFDLLNSNVYLLLGVKNYFKKIKQIRKNETLRTEEIKKIENNKNVKINNIVRYDFKNIDNEKINLLEYVIPTKYKIDLISGLNLESYSYKKDKISKEIENIKKLYDIIIIDTSNNYISRETKEVSIISDKIIFISGANVLEIKKSKDLLNICEKEWGIEKEKINIIFNKYTSKSIEGEILKNIFKDYHILGKLELNEYYDKIINENNIKLKEIQKELEQIRKNIMKEKKNINGIN